MPDCEMYVFCTSVLDIGEGFFKKLPCQPLEQKYRYVRGGNTLTSQRRTIWLQSDFVFNENLNFFSPSYSFNLLKILLHAIYDD